MATHQAAGTDGPADHRIARDLLQRSPLIDGHNDLAWALRDAGVRDLDGVDLAAPVGFTHTDLPRLAAGGVGGQFWSVYVPAELDGGAAVTTTLEQIDLVHRIIGRHPGVLALALSATDAERAAAAGQLACLLGAEGGHSIGCSMGALRMLYALGVRYLTLTHNRNVPWADSATDQPAAGGLTGFGREVVREMQRLGMLVDLSHVAHTTMHGAMDIAEAPVIFSHSCARSVCDHPRNVPDDVLARLADGGGVCMATFVPAFASQACRDYELEFAAEMARRGLDQGDRFARQSLRTGWERTHPRPAATLAQVADHIDHIRQVAGVGHVGLGGDYDGTDRLPRGLHDVSCYPALIAELLGRGWSEADCGRLARGNILRVMHEAEAAARAISARRGPSQARIDDLDETPASGIVITP
jgi:membrane dipeptidase